MLDLLRLGGDAAIEHADGVAASGDRFGRAAGADQGRGEPRRPAGVAGAVGDDAAKCRDRFVVSARLAVQPAQRQDGEADIVAVEAGRRAMGLDGPIPVTDPLAERCHHVMAHGESRTRAVRFVALALEILPVPDHRAELGLCVLQPTRVR